MASTRSSTFEDFTTEAGSNTTQTTTTILPMTTAEQSTTTIPTTTTTVPSTTTTVPSTTFTKQSTTRTHTTNGGSEVTSAPGVSSTTVSGNEDSGSLPIGALIGCGIVGAIIIGALISVIVICYYRKKKRQNRDASATKNPQGSNPPSTARRKLGMAPGVTTIRITEHLTGDRSRPTIDIRNPADFNKPGDRGTFFENQDIIDIVEEERQRKISRSESNTIPTTVTIDNMEETNLGVPISKDKEKDASYDNLKKMRLAIDRQDNISQQVSGSNGHTENTDDMSSVTLTPKFTPDDQSIISKPSMSHKPSYAVLPDISEFNKTIEAQKKALKDRDSARSSKEGHNDEYDVTDNKRDSYRKLFRISDQGSESNLQLTTLSPNSSAQNRPTNEVLAQSDALHTGVIPEKSTDDNMKPPKQCNRNQRINPDYVNVPEQQRVYDIAGSHPNLKFMENTETPVEIDINDDVNESLYVKASSVSRSISLDRPIVPKKPKLPPKITEPNERKALGKHGNEEGVHLPKILHKVPPVMTVHDEPSDLPNVCNTNNNQDKHRHGYVNVPDHRIDEKSNLPILQIEKQFRGNLDLLQRSSGPYVNVPDHPTHKKIIPNIVSDMPSRFSNSSEPTRNS